MQMLHCQGSDLDIAESIAEERGEVFVRMGEKSEGMVKMDLVGETASLVL